MGIELGSSSLHAKHLRAELSTQAPNMPILNTVAMLVSQGKEKKQGESFSVLGAKDKQQPPGGTQGTAATTL